MSLRRAAGLLAAASIAAGGAPARAEDPAPAALVLAPCRLAGLEHDALCGTLRRPLDPAHPAGTSFDLHVAVLPALARHKEPDPILFFAGGPGQSAIALAGTVERLMGRLGMRRDIVLVDQRGTGHSAPLHCDTPSSEEALARAFDRARAVAALDACRVQLERLPWGDLRLYGTTIAMADADAVRAALGADRVNLVGVSYGTRAALEYLRLHPGRVRRMVLDGVAAPDMTLPRSIDDDAQAALAGAFAACAGEPACALAHPRLERTWAALLDTLPRAVDLDNPVDGRPARVTLTRDAVQQLVRPGLYVPALGAILPQAIDDAAAGRFGPLLALGATPLGGGANEIAEGEHFSVVCAEDAPRLGPESAGEAGSVALYRAVCAHWPRAAVSPGFYTVAAAPAPVLLLSGSADPVTPPRHAERVAQALGARARAVVVPNSAHGQLGIACLRDAAARFIEATRDDDAMRVETGCAARQPRPPAFQPLRPAPAASAVNDPGPYRAGGGSHRSGAPVAQASSAPASRPAVQASAS